MRGRAKQAWALGFLILLTSQIGLAARWDFHIPDVTGRMHSSAELQKRRAVVLLFLATDCPISNRYAPTINRMVETYTAKNVEFLIVHSDPELRAKDAAQHAKEFGLRATILMDPTQELASKFGALVTPTAIVVTPEGQILYSGRIDDRNIDLGQYRDNPKREDLRLALDEILNGQTVSVPTTKTVGCFLPPPRKKAK